MWALKFSSNFFPNGCETPQFLLLSVRTYRRTETNIFAFILCSISLDSPRINSRAVILTPPPAPTAECIGKERSKENNHKITVEKWNECSCLLRNWTQWIWNERLSIRSQNVAASLCGWHWSEPWLTLINAYKWLINYAIFWSVIWNNGFKVLSPAAQSSTEERRRKERSRGDVMRLVRFNFFNFFIQKREKNFQEMENVSFDFTNANAKISLLSIWINNK